LNVNKRSAERYRWSQIVLHWLIVTGVTFQYATSGAIGRTHHVPPFGVPPDPWDLLLHTIHNRLGLAILLLVAIRLCLLLRYGKPEWSFAVPRWKLRLATGVHAAFYVILAGQAATGALASYVWWPISVVHRWLFIALLCAIALHLAGVAASLLLSWRETVWRITGLDLSTKVRSEQPRPGPAE
jgi:cytochrome b561